MKKLLIALVLLAALLLAAVACTAPIENETTDSTTTQAPSGDNTDETGLANGGADTDSSWGELHPIN